MKCAVNGCISDALSISCYCRSHGIAAYKYVPYISDNIVVGFGQPITQSMSTKYPKYYKPIPKGMTEIDFYGVCQLFDVTDAAISHSLKKLMLPGVRTGGKSRHADIKEARDTLTRWLELNPE